MNIGTITKSNQKGQIVIPKNIRDELHITKDVSLNIIKRGRGVYIYPITDVVSADDGKDAYLRILEKTQGSWTENWDKLEKQKRCVELEASKKRKKAW